MSRRPCYNAPGASTPELIFGDWDQMITALHNPMQSDIYALDQDPIFGLRLGEIDTFGLSEQAPEIEPLPGFIPILAKSDPQDIVAGGDSFGGESRAARKIEVAHRLFASIKSYHPHKRVSI